MGRRFGALAVDWALCMLIAYALFSGGDAQSAGNWALGILLVMNILTVGTVGCTPGKLLLRLRVISENGGRLGLGRAVARSVLLCLAVPALVWDRDSRGLHDRLGRAVQIRV
ncbi:RDD family protein OS=Streptomyces rutgersensis OX=53451 GN=F0345_06675 PE=4 SV=1 [Streptomyces diastaticus subsp. diastaticus]